MAPTSAVFVSSGTYTLSAGTLNNFGGEEVGYNGTGVFNQNGGVNNANFVAVGNFLQAGGRVLTTSRRRNAQHHQ